MFTRVLRFRPMCWCHLLIKSIKDIESFAIRTTIQIMLPMLLKLLIFTFVKQVWNHTIGNHWRLSYLSLETLYLVLVSLQPVLKTLLPEKWHKNHRRTTTSPHLTDPKSKSTTQSMFRSIELAKWGGSLCNAFCCSYSWLWTYWNNKYFSSTDKIKLRIV